MKRYGRTRPPQPTPYLRYLYLLFLGVAIATVAVVSYKVLMETSPGHQLRAWLGENVPHTLAWLGFEEWEEPKIAQEAPSSPPEPEVNPHQGMGYIVKSERQSHLPSVSNSDPFSSWAKETSSESNGIVYTLHLVDPNSSYGANALSQITHGNILADNVDHKHFNRGLSQSYGTATLKKRIRIVFLNASGAERERVLEPGYVLEVARRHHGFLRVRVMGREGLLPEFYTE